MQPQTTAILLVEDNPGDAMLVAEMLVGEEAGRYELDRASRLSDALDRLHTRKYDVVLIDLELPDSSGVSTVARVRPVADPSSIVVLSGSDDDTVVEACIRAGADDFLIKQEFLSGRGHGARSLRRTIGNALLRVRESQLKQARDSLAHYHALTSSAQTTRVTATLAGSGALSARYRDLFESLICQYLELVQPYLAQITDRIEPRRHAMERIISTLGDHGGGPRDLVDLHVSALERAIAQTHQSRPLVYEARLLALEMMGILVDYYRVGHRRRFE